jgi:hypothetical protein
LGVALVTSLLRSNIHQGYVYGTFPCPTFTITTATKEDGEVLTKPNLQFKDWIQQDQMIVSSFLSSSTIEVGNMIMFAKRSHETWTPIE